MHTYYSQINSFMQPLKKNLQTTNTFVHVYIVSLQLDPSPALPYEVHYYHCPLHEDSKLESDVISTP